VAYSVAGTYEDTLITANGCDSITTLVLSVLPVLSSTETASICEGTSYTFNGVEYTLAGTYVDTLTTANGCDSITTLVLSVLPVLSSTELASICEGTTYNFNGIEYTTAGTYIDTLTSANGCDSVTTLVLSLLPVLSSTEMASICEGTSYIFNGTVYSAAGTYLDTLTAVNGCDSIITLQLIVLPVANLTQTAVICEGSSYAFNGTDYTTSGTYTDTLTSINGCDSIITLILVVLPELYYTETASICEGSSYTFNGTEYTTAGTYADTLSAASGCDSISSLFLTVIPTLNVAITASICEGTSYNFNNIEYTAGGTYVATLTSASGCDSIVTLTLGVLPVSNIIVEANICEGAIYEFNGNFYSTEGFYTDTLTAYSGCDSIMTLALTVLPVPQTQQAISICEGNSYLFSGSSYSASGIYSDTLTASNGCDSISTLVLSVLDVFTTNLDANICEGENYQFQGNSYTASGVYTDTLLSSQGCDSILVLSLVVNAHTSSTITTSICDGESFLFNGLYLSTAGTYVDTLTNANGCDSIATLVLTVLPVPVTNLSESICQGETYAFNGFLYSISGVYVDTLTTFQGCDSIVTLELYVIPSVSSEISASICQGESYSFNGNVFSASGIYSVILTSYTGCDSTVTLLLTVHPLYDLTISAAICEGQAFEFNGNTFTNTGIYTDSLLSESGCDSIVSLNLIVWDLPTVEILGDTLLCEGETIPLNLNTSAGQFLWSDSSTESSLSVSQQGIFSVTVTDSNGCTASDEHLVSFAPPAFAFAGNDTMLNCYLDPVILGPPITQNGNYSWSGPGISSNNANSQNPSVSTPGLYVLLFTNEFGCTDIDSVTVNPPVSNVELFVGPDQALTCNDSSVVLQGGSNIQNVLYFWSGPGINTGNSNLPNPMVSIPGTYSLVVQDTVTGCFSPSAEVNVADNAVEPNIALESSGELNCFTGSVTLDASGSATGQGIGYIWMNDLGIIVTNLTQVSINEPGNYYLIVVDSLTGCVSTQNVVVEDLMTYPAAEAGDPVLINCYTPSASLDASDSDSSSNILVQWTGPPGGIVSGQNSLSPTVSVSGIYVLTVTDTVNGCQNIDSVLVISDFLYPEVVLPDTALLTCLDDFVILSPTSVSQGSDIAYDWATDAGNIITGEFASEVWADQIGEYFLEVTDLSNGCASIDSMIVVEPSPFDVSIVTQASCQNSSDGTIAITQLEGGVPPYELSFNGGLFTAQTQYENLSTGNYSLVVQDAAGCEWDTTVNLPAFPELLVELGQDIFITLGDSADLNALVSLPFSQIASTQWSPSDQIPCELCLDATVMPLETTTYFLTVTDTNSCPANDKIIVYVNKNVNVYTPNTFSPNGDGINDIFTIFVGVGVVKVRELYIFDRWGDNVFYMENFPPNDPGFGWDGTFRGKPMDPAVFAFYTILELIDGSTYLLEGDITLVR
jgi:gliding motility-associated-like protein